MNQRKRKNDPSIPLVSAERLRDLLMYEPETGVFTNRVTRNARSCAGAISGSPDADGYLLVCLEWRTYKLHQLAFLYMTGEWPTGLVDHKDTCRSNNAWANLRDVSHSINSQNRRTSYSNSGTGLLGTSFDKTKNKYVAQISINGKQTNLGRYATAEIAHQVYLEAKRKHHKGNTL